MSDKSFLRILKWYKLLGFCANNNIVMPLFFSFFGDNNIADNTFCRT